MSDYCVVVLDAARARFFSVEPARRPRTESGPRLLERTALLNPEEEMRDDQLFSETRTGAHRSGTGPARRYDDHRSRHRAEFLRRFAARIVKEICRTADDLGARTVVLAASRSMLGALRACRNRAATHLRDWKELDRELTRQPPDAIQARLARAGLIPACHPPTPA